MPCFHWDKLVASEKFVFGSGLKRGMRVRYIPLGPAKVESSTWGHEVDIKNRVRNLPSTIREAAKLSPSGRASCQHLVRQLALGQTDGTRRCELDPQWDFQGTVPKWISGGTMKCLKGSHRWSKGEGKRDQLILLKGPDINRRHSRDVRACVCVCVCGGLGE